VCSRRPSATTAPPPALPLVVVVVVVVLTVTTQPCTASAAAAAAAAAAELDVNATSPRHNATDGGGGGARADWEVLIAKFHYTDPHGPARTFLRPGSPRNSLVSVRVSDKVRVGLVGSGRARVVECPCSGI